jgi:hypothetical protein
MDIFLQALSSIRAHLENVVTGSLMNDIEELAEGFLNRLIARHASRVIVSPVFTSTLPCSDSN